MSKFVGNFQTAKPSKLLIKLIAIRQKYLVIFQLKSSKDNSAEKPLHVSLD